MHSLLVASSSALAAHRKLLGARAARLSTTARRKLLGGSRCALAHHSSSLRARLLGGSRCALARHGSSQAPPLEFAFCSARLAPRSICLFTDGSTKFRASAELDRSSPCSLKQALMFRTSRRSSQLPWPPKPPPRTGTESQAV